MNPPHARAFDLPGWPSPPRVRDIPQHEESWGFVPVVSHKPVIIQDELGYLWADGNACPRFELPNEDHASPGGIVFWTPEGLGIWIHPKSLKGLGSMSRLDMEQDQWIPIAVAAAELPPFVTK